MVGGCNVKVSLVVAFTVLLGSNRQDVFTALASVAGIAQLVLCWARCPA